VFSIVVSGCVEETPTAMADEVVVTEITDTEHVDQIVQTRLYNQCGSLNPLRIQMQFSESISEAKQSELVLFGSVGGEVGVAAKVQLQASIQQKFATIYTAESGYHMAFDFEIPAQTHQEFTLIWRETWREGSVYYTENGEAKSANYSYRVGLDFVASNTNDIGCQEMPSEPTEEVPEENLPTPTPEPKSLAGGCISTGTWGVYSSDPDALGKISSDAEGCFDLSAIGIFPDRGGVLRIFDRGQRNHLTHGIYTPISNDAVIEFKFLVNSMYLVWPDAPAYVSFAVAPESDPITARNSARFRLWVDTVGQQSIVFFRLANVGDSTGYRLPGQRNEFGRTYTIRLELAGNIMRVYVNGRDTKEALKIPTEPKVFYIGYHLPIAAGIDVSITDVKIDGVLK
jgi:hypothetical protein